MILGDLVKVVSAETLFEVREEHNRGSCLFDSDKTSSCLPDEYKKLQDLKEREISAIGYDTSCGGENVLVVYVKIVLPKK